ncbi:MAG: zinc ribbon domain-containing protein [Parachlamydia sp.]|nr:zinc ribbon domain-containing protein [Parachlamydia sp.]
MPTYAYKCDACQHELETFQKIVDAPLTQCPQCHKETLRRGPGGGIGILFSGGGWAKDNYGQPSSSGSSESSKGSCCPCGKSQGSCDS